MNKSVGGLGDSDAPLFDAQVRRLREERERYLREQRAAADREANRQAWFAAVISGVIGVAVLVVLSMLTGCATPPPPSPFAECMRLVAAPAIYQDDKLRAADWCAEHEKNEH